MIGFSLFTIALGAILRYAVTAHPGGVDLSTIGLILIVVGGIGLVVGVWLYLVDRGKEPLGESGSDTDRRR